MQSVKRLYELFHPEHYNLTFDLSDQNNDHSFSVVVTITGEKISEEPLRLHAKELSIVSVTVDSEPIEQYHLEQDELVIETKHVGQLNIVVEAHGTMTDAMHGMYPCYYTHKGEKKELFATQFESHHAREAFPCIDEPEAKATFDVTLITKPDLTVLSNMPAKTADSRQLTADSISTTFQTTPRMSTYLLAFVVGDLQKKSIVTNRGVEVNIYATPVHAPDSLDYALDWAKRSIEFFEEYFDVPYPLPKSDHVAVPDFSAGAMENWGLVTYRESALLLNPDQATTETKQVVSDVISHEVSHQWFGNLVTMQWWDDLWLNESFANLMSYTACDALEPSWKIWERFSVKECQQALRRDALDGIQPVKVDVGSPDEIGTLFDHAIVYAKGSRLLRMLHDFIGDEAFRSGLRAYFKQYAYQNTTEHDLWNSFASVSGKDIATFINSWLTKPGYPLVRFTDSSVSQERFFLGKSHEDATIWHIPLLSNNTTFPSILETKSLSVENILLILNMGDGAHFITNYQDDQLKNIVNAIQHNKLGPIDTARIIYEQSLLMLTGKTNVVTLIPTLMAAKNSSSVAVWKTIAQTFESLQLLATYDELNGPLLRGFVERLTATQYARLGWRADEHELEENTRLRPVILSLVGYTATDRAIRAAHASADMEHFETMDPNTRVAIARMIVSTGIDDSDFAHLFDLYRSTVSPELRNDLIATLTATKAPEQVTMIIASLTDGTVRPQDIRRWLPALLASPEARAATWQWMRQEWPWIVKTFKGDMIFDTFPTVAGRYLTSTEELEQYKEFFKPWRVEPALKRAIDIGENELAATVAYINLNRPLLEEALRNVKEPAP